MISFFDTHFFFINRILKGVEQKGVEQKGVEQEPYVTHQRGFGIYCKYNIKTSKYNL